MPNWYRFWARGPNSPQQRLLFRQVSQWFSSLIFQTQKQGWKTHLHYWQSSGLNKMSPLNCYCKSSKLVLCTCRLQLASGSAFLRGKWVVNSHPCLQLKTSEPALWLHSAGGQVMAMWQPGGQQDWPGTAPRCVLQVIPESQFILLLGHCRKPSSSHSPSAISAFRPSVHVARGLLVVFSLHWSYKIKQWHAFINIL